jgi:ferredoxin
MTWRVTVDSGLCIGSGMCLGTAPDRFRFDDRQRSSPVAALIEPDDAVLDAAVNCPVEAISLTDADTGEPVPLDA